MNMDDAQRLRIYRPEEDDAEAGVSAGRRELAGAGETIAHPDLSARNLDAVTDSIKSDKDLQPDGLELDSKLETPGILGQASGLIRRFMLFTGYAVVACWLTGCSALRPLHGIPPRQLPPELRGVSRANMETIDLSRLSQTPHGHFVDSGDLLGIYIYGILGKIDETPPVYVPQTGDGNPTIGLPIPVRDDGTISLPQIPALYVRGMTVRQVEEAVRREYVSRRIREAGTDILVSLQRSRSYKVTVLRQEAGNTPLTGLAGGIQLGATKKGTGQIVTLPAGENDVLRALTVSGGLPGLDVQNAIYVLRRPRLVRQTPPPVRLSSVNGPHSKNKFSTPILLTSGTTATGNRYEFASGSNNHAIRTVSQFGYSVPSGNAAPWGNSQSLVQLEGRRESAAPWNQAAPPAAPDAVNNGQTGVRGIGYSAPVTKPMPGLGIAAEDLPEQLPEPRSESIDPSAVARPYDLAAPAVDVVERPAIVANGNTYVPPELQPYMMSGAQVLRIPIRLRPGEQAYFTERDILLFDGDIIFIESRETEIFYTGGLLGGGQYSLPRDYDLDIIDAISIAQGRVAATAATGTGAHIGGISSTNQDISVSASVLIVVRRLPDGRRVNIKIDLYKALRDENENLLVQPGDHLILRYTPLEAIGAFIERNLLAGSLIGLAAQTQGLGTSSSGK
ncbi:MAG: polysaccharide export protein [Planctomycetaceae bacterium]|nr:polysaccharide export protein [Planctomycetaceae bacterium]